MHFESAAVVNVMLYRSATLLLTGESETLTERNRSRENRPAALKLLEDFRATMSLICPKESVAGMRRMIVYVVADVVELLRWDAIAQRNSARG